MSRTILLSEVNEVAGRYPEIIEQIRATLAGAQLPIDGEHALQALTDRIHDKPLFCEDMHEALSAALTPVPQITQLEALAVLVQAAVGPAYAAALADSVAADVPVRALFKFVLASRRRSRETAGETTDNALQQLYRAPMLHAALEPEQAVLEQQSKTKIAAAVEAMPAAALSQDTPARELLTATAPGDFGMLGRALAFAADQEPLPRQTHLHDEPLPPAQPLPVAQPLPTAAEPVVASTSRSARRAERFPLRTIPTAEALGTDTPEDGEEEVEQRPRRWGMGTAVMCGVLMGFAVGAFVHFDHKSPTGPLSTIAPAVTQSASTSKGKVKSVEELSAEIAALDSLANAPTPTSEAGADRPEPVTAPATSGRRANHLQPRQPVRRDYEPLPPAQDQQPATITRSTATGNALNTPPPSTIVRPSTAAAPAAFTAAASATTPAPLVTNAAQAGVFHNASAMRPPHVVTGSAGIMAANLISSPAPAYPAAASAAGVQGEVVVEAVVGREGEVVGTRVVSGPLLLRTAALEAVQHWHYRPYEVDGKPVEVATTARVEFRLDQ